MKYRSARKDSDTVYLCVLTSQSRREICGRDFRSALPSPSTAILSPCYLLTDREPGRAVLFALLFFVICLVFWDP